MSPLPRIYTCCVFWFNEWFSGSEVFYRPLLYPKSDICYKWRKFAVHDNRQVLQNGITMGIRTDFKHNTIFFIISLAAERLSSDPQVTPPMVASARCNRLLTLEQYVTSVLYGDVLCESWWLYILIPARGNQNRRSNQRVQGNKIWRHMVKKEPQEHQKWTLCDEHSGSFLISYLQDQNFAEMQTTELCETNV